MITITQVSEEISVQVGVEARNPNFTENLFNRLKEEDPAVAAFMLAYKETHGEKWRVVEPAAVVYRMLELASQRPH